MNVFDLINAGIRFYWSILLGIYYWLIDKLCNYRNWPYILKMFLI